VTALDAADLVVIAGRTLGIGTDAALARMDIDAAQDALAEARPNGQRPGRALPDRAAAASAAVGLVRALLRHRPFPERGQQVAVAAGLQFLSLNGWRADLNPAGAAAVVVEALASGRLSPHDAAAWLAPRLSPVRRARQIPIAVPRPRPGLPISLPAVRVPVARAAAGAMLAVAVTGVTLFAAACSRGPDMSPAQAGRVSAVQQSPGALAAAGGKPAPGAETTRQANLAYAACMRSHGVESFPSPEVDGVAIIAPAAGIDPNSPQFRSAAGVCRVTEPAATVHVIVAAARK
jgi:hypothetical protein